MSINSQKVQSLPSDLKKIADELIGKKFPEEVKREKSRDTFRGMGFGGPDPNTLHRDYYEPAYTLERWGDGDVQVQVRPWDNRRNAQVRIHRPTYDGIKDAFMTLRRENISIQDSTIWLDPSWWNHIMSNPELSIAVTKSTTSNIPHLFGTKVNVSHSVSGGILAATF